MLTKAGKKGKEKTSCSEYPFRSPQPAAAVGFFRTYNYTIKGGLSAEKQK